MTREATCWLGDISGTKIENVNLYSLRDSIGYVPQDPFLFSDTLNNNIKFGKNKASDQDVIQAAKDAVVHDNIINFSKGYDTVLGERGITLSGGQKQRVSIARAFIKSPKILLLDDCLSAVDTETEEVILKSIRERGNDAAVLLISHRISSIRGADHVVVLDAGQVVEAGTPSELAQAGGLYARMVEQQTEPI